MREGQGVTTHPAPSAARALRLASLYHEKQGAAIGDVPDLILQLRIQVSAFMDLEQEARMAEDIIKKTPRSPSGGFNWYGVQNAMHHEGLNRDVTNMGYTVAAVYHRLSQKFATLCMALLQQYALPPATRKSVEKAAKFFTRSAIRTPKAYKSEEDALKVYKLYFEHLDFYRSFLSVAGGILATGKAHTEAPAEGAPDKGGTKMKVGPFTLVNTGGFSQEVMNDVAEAVAEAVHYIKGSGLEKVLYGDLLVTNQIKSHANVMAFYIVASDEMMVRATTRKGAASVHTLVHELGHRMQFKFMRGRDREIDRLYQEIDRGGSADKALMPKPGDHVMLEGLDMTVRAIKGPKIEVTPVMTPAYIAKERSRVEKHVLKARPSLKDHPDLLEDQVVQTLAGMIYTAPVGMLVAENPKFRPVDFKGFVTSYAKTSPTENFAEMFAFYCTGELPPTQSVAFEALVFDGKTARVRGLARRYLIAAMAKLAIGEDVDYDEEPEDPINQAVEDDLAFWEKVDGAYARFVKTWITPLVKNDQVPQERRKQLEAAFSGPAGDFQAVVEAFNHKRQDGCDYNPYPGWWKDYASDAQKLQRQLDSRKEGTERRAAAFLENTADRFKSYASDPTRMLWLGVSRHEAEAIKNDPAQLAKWSQGCLEVAEKATDHSYGLRFNTYDAAGEFKRVFAEIAQVVKTKILPLADDMWKTRCALDLAFARAYEMWRAYLKSTQKVAALFLEKSAVRQLLIRVRESLEAERDRADRMPVDDTRPYGERDRYTYALSNLYSQAEKLKHTFTYKTEAWDGWPSHAPKGLVTEMGYELKNLNAERGRLVRPF